MKKAIFLIIVVALTACNRERIKISGKFVNAGKQVLYLEEVSVYETHPVDSIVLEKNGRFSFTLDSKEPGFYQLRFDSTAGNVVLFPEPGEHLRITADASRLLPTLKLEGSPATEQVTTLIRLLDQARVKLDSLRTLYTAASSDTMRGALVSEYDKVLESHRKNSVAYILTHTNSLSSLYALYQQYYQGDYVFYKATDLQFFRIVSDSLSKYYPKSKHVTALKASTDNLIGKYKAEMIMQSVPAETGLPLLALPDTRGDTVNLRSFKGKVVLLAFWTTSCSECVKQNLELKKLYERYGKKGFEIVQVSFDNSTDAWKSQMRFDELPWISLIDTRYPNSPILGNFNISGLPANYLIGKDNVSILGKDLTPTEIRNKLEDLIK